MRLYGMFVGMSLGMIVSGLISTIMLVAPRIILQSNEEHTFPVPADTSRLRQHSTIRDSSNMTFDNEHTESVRLRHEHQCPTWNPKKHEQVLVIAFHPEKTAGSSMARFLELQEKANGGDFEMMTPWDETWLLQWLGDAKFREMHPRVFCHLHGKGSYFAKRKFRRERILEVAKTLPEEIQSVVQADAVDPSATGFFEYLLKLLALHAPRLEKQGARLLAVPSWREPGQHFVSGLMFLNLVQKKYHGEGRLGVMQHAKRALESLGEEEDPKHEYYKPEVLLLYYYGLDSPLVSALHNVGHVESMAMELSETNNVDEDDESTRDESNAIMSFMEAYKHIYDFMLETSNVTLWAITEQLDQTFLLLSYEAGFLQIYEDETCLPLWDTIHQNSNHLRKRDSIQENIAAGIGRTIMSPGASTIHPLILDAHNTLWTRHVSEFEAHETAIRDARKRYSKGVTARTKAKRKERKLFLQQERFPKPVEKRKKRKS